MDSSSVWPQNGHCTTLVDRERSRLGTPDYATKLERRRRRRSAAVDINRPSMTSAPWLALLPSAQPDEPSLLATPLLPPGSVNTEALQGEAVTSAKIANGTIVNADIANGTINAGEKLLNELERTHPRDLEYTWLFRSFSKMQIWDYAAAIPALMASTSTANAARRIFKNLPDGKAGTTCALADRQRRSARDTAERWRRLLPPRRESPGRRATITRV